MPNLQTLIFLIFTLTLMTKHANSQSRKIILGTNDHLTVKMLNPEELEAMKKNSAFSQAGTLPADGATRTFETADGEIILEFYNGAAIVARSREDAAQLPRVSFQRVLFSSRRNEVSYWVDIDEASFNRLKEEAKQFGPGEHPAFFGDAFYQMDSGHVLVAWSERFNPGKYAVLESIRTLIGFDPELAAFLEKEQPDPVEYDMLRKRPEEPSYGFRFEIKDGRQANLEEIKAILSVALNIDRDSLDFSMESINKVGASFLWNADNLALEDLHLPCAAYLGEALARQHQLEWEQPEGYEYCILKSKTGRRIDIVERLTDGFVDNDYWGVVDLKWTVEGVARMLSAEKK
ncbi:MAG: hypothetical protein J5I98_01425 [Phaeodactylibacter sp.]|nr:hypothetical protein [Phaeodactylibacter sp.]